MSTEAESRKLLLSVGSPNTLVVNPVPPAKTIRISLFFDGTLNNKTNTDIGKKGAPEAGWGEGVGSYENDYSNVARIEQGFVGGESYDFYKGIYIEGIGTENSQADSMRGAALGTGDTGIEKKVQKGLTQLKNQINSWKKKLNEKIAYIHVDAFGFSRGAAAARHFCHLALNDEDWKLTTLVESIGLEVADVDIRFVGLFDTVASHGVTHSNDTEDLKLDAVANAKKVIHLTAAEEHRKNFRLTNIESVVGKKGNSKPGSYEIFLPGVHSDIGGGYVNESAEKDLQILSFGRINNFFNEDEITEKMQKEIKRLTESGWYKPGDLRLSDEGGQKLLAKRSGILNAYSFIPLSIMVDFLKEDQLKVTWKLEIDSCPPQKLDSIASRIDAYVDRVKGGSPSLPTDWIKEVDDDIQELRYNYLHTSAYYGETFGSMDPQFCKKGVLKGTRQRVVQYG